MEKQYVTKHRHFLHGGDYNPEQWLKYPDILKKDIEYMKKAHCNCMSIGIFSWSFLEPEEGKYNFEYMDEIIKNLTDNGIKIVLATPSGARPRWLAEKYPEVLRVNTHNQRELYSARHNHCYTSEVYREKTANIDRLLAQRYKDNPSVLMWHISNEFGGECHCDKCQAAFRIWLKKRYNNDLDALNEAWWTGFWSHTVTDWEQIHSPSDIGEPKDILTGLYLDWKDFVTYQTTDFMMNEINAVKEITPDIPVTTNFMAMSQQLDYHYMKDYVDVISWDSYPFWHSDEGNVNVACRRGFEHDLQRCFKNKPFMLMESTPSLTNWADICKLKKPGMHKLASVQAIAHGSDTIQYFQWRKGRGGSEKLHGAVIDHNGKAEGRVFEDVRQLGITLEKLDGILGSQTVSQAAIVYEFRNRWALDNAQGFQNKDKLYSDTCVQHYNEFWKRGINVDVIGIKSDFSKYKLLVLPMLYSISEEDISRIEEYAANGGTVLATYMTGYVNETDLCYLGGFPGSKLKDVFGLTADEIDSLYKTDSNSVKMSDKSYKAVDYCELITTDTAQTLGAYEQDFYAGKPVVLKNKYKNGTAYYIGCRDTGELINDIYGTIIDELNIPYYNLPYGVTVHTRENDEKKYTFIGNYSQKEQGLALNNTYVDVENGEKVDKELKLGAYEVRILEKL